MRYRIKNKKYLNNDFVSIFFPSDFDDYRVLLEPSTRTTLALLKPPTAEDIDSKIAKDKLTNFIET